MAAVAHWDLVIVTAEGGTNSITSRWLCYLVGATMTKASNVRSQL